MKKALGLALAVGGAFMLFYGFKAKDSLESKVNELVKGSPTDKSMLMIGGGAAMCVAGVVLVMSKK
ncbi:MAG TPA: DUF3185 family protein [Verrucomicrobiae bacterium]